MCLKSCYYMLYVVFCGFVLCLYICYFMTLCKYVFYVLYRKHQIKNVHSWLLRSGLVPIVKLAFSDHGIIRKHLRRYWSFSGIITGRR